MRTRQQIFDIVARHLVRQRAKSEVRHTHESECRYRQGALKCAVGALIPDSKYTTRLEGTNPGCPPLDASLLRAANCRKRDACLLHELQQVHDDNDVCDWPQELVKVATKYALDLHVLDRELRRLS
jgi:hypothetical protein